MAYGFWAFVWTKVSRGRMYFYVVQSNCWLCLFGWLRTMPVKHVGRKPPSSYPSPKRTTLPLLLRKSQKKKLQTPTIGQNRSTNMVDGLPGSIFPHKSYKDLHLSHFRQRSPILERPVDTKSFPQSSILSIFASLFNQPIPLSSGYFTLA